MKKNNFNKIKDIVEIVIKDSKKGRQRASGAMDMLERMYNFDKRSLQSNLLKAVSEIALGADGGILREKFIEFYNDIGPMVYNSEKNGHRFRYLCRRAIIRILLNQIEIENRRTFFDGIYFSEYGEECMQSSYMRKLLIYLIHHQVIDNKISDNYVLLDDVINAIARPNGNSEINDEMFEQIVLLIYRMSDFRLHNSAWQQLISIRVNSSDKQFFTDEKKFVEKIKHLYSEHKLAETDFGVRLNYAGAFLAYIQSDFEFFACRCKEFRVPLIFSKDVNYIKTMLDAVHSKAINCIKMVIEDERDTFGNYREMYNPEKKYLYKDCAFIDKGRLISHPKRIINNHILYLDHYRCFVSAVDGIFSAAEKTNIINKINQVINRYKSNYNELVEGFGYEGGDFYAALYLKDQYGNPYFWRSTRLD